MDCTAVNAGNSDWTCLTCVEELFPFAAIEDDIEYWNSLFIHSHGFRADSQLITNVGQLRLMTRSLKFDRDLDPNRNCLNLHKSSNYVTEGNFNSITHQITGGAYFSVLHINARSLIKIMTRSVILYIDFSISFQSLLSQRLGQTVVMNI